MENRIVDEELTLLPYFPNEKVALPWYQDRTLCKQVDNRDEPYSAARLQAMYSYLSTHGECYYIAYRGILVGDITLEDNAEIAIVICKEYQNLQIGRRCVKNLLARAREKGFPSVTAKIYAFNKQSQAMFLRCGFTQVGDELYQCAL